MVANLETAYTRLLGIKYPIVQGGMGPFDTSSLAAAVSDTGALGTVSVPGTAGDPAEAGAQLRRSIERCASLTEQVFAVNIPLGSDRRGGIAPFAEVYLETVLEARRGDPRLHDQIRVVTTSAGFDPGLSDRFHDEGLLHQHKVGSTYHAVKAAEAGADAIIASGLEMGGHTAKSGMHTFVLVPNVADAVDVPVVLSGGVRDGRGLAAALCLGASAVAMGTRFAASSDNVDWHAAYARAIIEADEGDDVLVDGLYGPVRALRNEATLRLSDPSTSQPRASDKIVSMRSAQVDGDVVGGLVLAGQVSSGIASMISCADFVPAAAAEAARLLNV